MLEQLQANQGKKIVLELVNGRVISGTVLAVEQQFVRLGTDEGIGTIPVSAVQIIWEAAKRSLTEENMEEIAGKLRDGVKAQYVCFGAAGFNCPAVYACLPPHACISFACPGTFADLGGGPTPCVAPFVGYETDNVGSVAGQAGQGNVKAHINCTAFPGFTCARQYICRPPDNCTFSFACPGSYVPGFPQGGGGCPFFACGPFQFGQPCSPFVFQQPCSPFVFQQPCGPFTFQQPCSPFVFQQPCGPFTFQQPCGPFTFGQPCGPFQFGQPCGPFQFGGSQCGVPGGFICPGQQFIGAVGPPGTAPGMAPGTAAVPPVPPMEFSIKKEDQGKDNKEVKE